MNTASIKSKTTFTAMKTGICLAKEQLFILPVEILFGDRLLPLRGI